MKRIEHKANEKKERRNMTVIYIYRKRWPGAILCCRLQGVPFFGVVDVCTPKIERISEAFYEAFATTCNNHL